MRNCNEMALRAAKTEKARLEPRAVGQWGAREVGILEVAGRLYAARGYERVSMADVAAAAGLSEGTLYNYFRDKTDLVQSVAFAGVERNVAEAERLAATATSFEAGLNSLIAHRLRSMIAAPELYRIWLREVKGAEGIDKSRARDALRRFSAQFSAFLDRWHPVGSDTDTFDRVLMRDMLYGGIEHIGWTAILQRKRRGLDVEAAATKLTRAYLAAFNATAAPLVIGKDKPIRTSAQRRSIARTHPDTIK
jgi:TetR/AcrR family transcriptional regulator, fatty acid metabolism regulator protein